MNTPTSSFSTQTITGVLCGALLGMIVAWWTAYSDKGINRKDMEEYVKEYSPYVIDRNAIGERQRQQDDSISRLSQTQQEVLRRLAALEKDGATP